MGTYNHVMVEFKKNGKWSVKEEETLTQNYSISSFLAGVRNYAECEPIAECKGFPDDSEYLNEKIQDWFPGRSITRREDLLEDSNVNNPSFLTLKELQDFDYNKSFLNKRAEVPYHNTYREYLGKDYFEFIERISKYGNPEDVRIIFWFT